MAEHWIEKEPQELVSGLFPGVAPTGVEEGNEHKEPLRKMEEQTHEGGSTSVTDVSIVDSKPWTKALYFFGSCSVNLILPFFNGLMLGFGELLAHEISWKYNWFRRSNAGYKIYPESRKLVGQHSEKQDLPQARAKRSGGFL